MAKYDYSKYEDPDWSDDWIYRTHEEDPDYDPDDEPSEETEEELDFVGWPEIEDACENEYWGIHEIDGGRLEIDVRRFEYACYRSDGHDRYPEGLRGKGDYYIPSKVHKHDYTYNYLMDSIQKLKGDWNKEYKPLFKEIFSPKDAEESSRVNMISMSADSDSYDDINLEAKLVGLRRFVAYRRIQSELYYTFLTKVMIEIHRIIFRAMTKRIYRNKRYSVRDLKSYCYGAGIDFDELENREVYQKYNNVYNFLKHNSIHSYKTLKKHNKECLIDTKEKYENGMFAMYWLDPKEVDIDKLLSDIVPFLRDLCEKVFKEDPETARWDYDDYFIKTKKELEDPMERFGI